ncbi:hypothetical protein [Desulfogranum japonicum]|uniref:hypothetical protein n=1 Tax=Desulfogranum japonicum TaxID=231447 RepID=UPI00041BF270|nr:hypothetical protein [Desulfogranum japonicum]
MSQANTKGRLLSDTLKPWHIILLTALLAALFGTQWWLNSHAAPDKQITPIEQQQSMP